MTAAAGAWRVTVHGSWQEAAGLWHPLLDLPQVTPFQGDAWLSHWYATLPAAEAAEPVRTEFKHIVEAQALGVTIADACARLPERVPVPESSFFAIVITIQQKAGGNLSEALGNLSRVLRERAKMKGKIKAMSMEAKASAWIIGSLPVLVMAITTMTSPKYIMLLFQHPLGNVILGISAVWMLIGVLVMRKMIDFKY